MLRRLVGCAREDLEAGAFTAVIGQGLTESTPRPQDAQHLVAVVGGVKVVERALFRTFSQQFRHVATIVVNSLAHLDSCAAVEPVGLDARRTGPVDLGFHGDAEFATITKRRLMVRRNAGRPGIEELALVEGADLLAAVSKVDRRAFADGEVAAADAVARLDNGAFITGLAQFIGGRQSGRTGAEDDDADALTATGRQIRHARPGLVAHQTHGLHGAIGAGGAHQGRETRDNLPSCCHSPAPIVLPETTIVIVAGPP